MEGSVCESSGFRSSFQLSRSGAGTIRKRHQGFFNSSRKSHKSRFLSKLWGEPSRSPRLHPLVLGVHGFAGPHFGGVLFLFPLCPTLAISLSTFADMTTYYCTTIEEALRRVKRAVKVAYPGCYFGGITLRSGRRGFAIYREGKVIEQYTAMGPGVK